MAKPNYEYSGVCYVATAGQTTFALTTTGGNAIGYLKPEHIKVRTSDDAGSTWNSLVLDTDWVFADPATSITLNTGATEDSWVDIHRETPVTKDYIEFQDGDLLTAGQLNDFDDWQLYIDQEILDRVENLTATDINLVDTDDLPEGSTNLYFTDARVEAWVDTNLDSTDKLAEGSTNLYFTDARVQAVIDGGGYITDAGVTQITAGSNVTISPVDGTGNVTINADAAAPGDGKITINQGGIKKGEFTVDQSGATTINLDAGGGSGGIVYRGSVDATAAAPAAVTGDLWINTATSGVVGSGWTGIVGESLIGNERLLYDGSAWSLIPGTGSGGIPEAPTDGQVYGRKGSDSSWVVAGGGGDANVQSDWNQSDDTKDDYIKNKPTIPAAQDLQSVCSQSSVTTTTIQTAGYRIDQLTAIASNSQ